MEVIGSYAHNHAQWNPKVLIVGAIDNNRLLIRDPTGKLIQYFVCIETIDAFSWSPDGNYVLCEIRSKATVQIFHLHSNKIARVEEGLAGLASAQWARGPQVITITDFGVRTCVWNLETKKMKILPGPKHLKALPFSPDYKWIAYLFRRGDYERIAVISTETWEVMSDFTTSLSDGALLSWSKDSTRLIVCESIVGAKIIIYSITGDELLVYEPYKDLHHSVVAPLGVKMMEISGSTCALGLHDNTIHLLCTKTHKFIGLMDIDWDHKDIKFYQEHSVKGKSTPTNLYDLGQPLNPPEMTLDDVMLLRMEGMKNPPKMMKKGYSFLSFCNENRYVAARCDGAPGNVCVFIWDSFRLCIDTVIIFRTPVKHLVWAPLQTILTISTTTDSRLYFWAPDQEPFTHKVGEAPTGAIRWCPNQADLLLLQSPKQTTLIRSHIPTVPNIPRPFRSRN